MKTLHNEDGMILLTVLILMFIATLLGVISINSSTVEVQLAGNEKRVSTSFAAAEAGLDLSIAVIELSLAAKRLDPPSMTVAGRPVEMDTAISSGTTKTQLFNEIESHDYANDAKGADDTESDIPDIFIPNIFKSDEGVAVAVSIDIDRLYSEAIAGGALEFAMGYEGVGAGAAGGGIATYYRINSAGGKK